MSIFYQDPGRGSIKYELYQLGMNVDEVNAAVEDLPSDEEKLVLLIKQLKPCKKWSYHDKLRLKHAMVKRGFSYQLVDQVIEATAIKFSDVEPC